MVTWSTTEPQTIEDHGHDHTPALDLLISVLDETSCPVIREPLRIIKAHIEEHIEEEPQRRAAA